MPFELTSAVAEFTRLMQGKIVHNYLDDMVTNGAD